MGWLDGVEGFTYMRADSRAHHYAPRTHARSHARKTQMTRLDPQLENAKTGLEQQELSMRKMGVTMIMNQLETAMGDGKLTQEDYHASLKKGFEREMKGYVRVPDDAWLMVHGPW